MIEWNLNNGMTAFKVPDMQKFLRFVGAKINGAMPSNEFSLVRLCAKWKYPDASADGLSKFASLRGKTKTVAVETTIGKEDLDIAADDLDHSDHQHHQEMFEDLVQQRLDRKGGGGKGGGRGGQGGKKGPQKPLLKVVPVRDDLTQEFAAVYIPPVAGCRIEKDSDFHYRWQGYYPRPPPLTRYCGQSFGVSSDKDALLFTLRQLWAWHKDIEKVECPFDFQSEIV